MKIQTPEKVELAKNSTQKQTKLNIVKKTLNEEQAAIAKSKAALKSNPKPEMVITYKHLEENAKVRICLWVSKETRRKMERIKRNKHRKFGEQVDMLYQSIKEE